MLPSRPNVGLPSGPRSHSIGRNSRTDEPSRHVRGSSQSSSSRHGQQAAFPREPSRSRGSESRPSRVAPVQYDSRSGSGSNRRSDDSATSSGSSLLDRMRSGASSFTSFEDVDDQRGMKSPPRGRSMRGKLSQPTSPAAEEPKSPVDGSKLWNRVASAAGLTVSVSKAWAANIVTYSGEDTPPGKESRLTRAMKAYHLSKASSPADLPPWLFEPHERRAPTTKSPTSSMRSPTSRSPTAKSPTSSLQYNSDDEPISPPQPRGFRDIYDAAQKNNAAKAPIGRMTDSAAPSKATDRLKALRDAKRSALTGGNNNNVVAQPDQTSSTIETNRPRMGLPSGPRRV